MHILIAPDSFKESLSATKVAEAIKKGFSKVYPQAGYDLIPLGDGGEGTVESLMQALSLDGTQTWVTGPFGDKIKVSYAVKDDLPEFPFENICVAFPIIASVESLEDTLQKAEKNLVRTAEQVARILQLGGQQRWN